ncbi:hypothetical protein PGB90_001407 [Kerria lacca]
MEHDLWPKFRKNRRQKSSSFSLSTVDVEFFVVEVSFSLSKQYFVTSIQVQNRISKFRQWR